MDERDAVVEGVPHEVVQLVLGRHQHHTEQAGVLHTGEGGEDRTMWPRLVTHLTSSRGNQ